jgi:cellulose biosynthesis protein BcsQ
MARAPWPPRATGQRVANCFISLSCWSVTASGLASVRESVWEHAATSDLRTLIDDASKVRRVNVRLVWTRFRAYTTLAQELSHDAEKALGLHALKTSLGYRVAYAEALGQGRTAAEVHDPAAKGEVLSLVQEIKRLIR